MTPDEQRIAIAEALGWTQIQPSILTGYVGVQPGGRIEPVPNFLSDLNVMHEAEKTLEFSEKIKFHTQLRSIRSRDTKDIYLVAWRECISSTASQRAEAFLRAKGLWKEDAA